MAEVEAEPGLADAARAVATIGGGVVEPAVMRAQAQGGADMISLGHCININV